MEIVYICGVENVGDNEETKHFWRLRSLGPEVDDLGSVAHASCSEWWRSITEFKQVSTVLTNLTDRVVRFVHFHYVRFVQAKCGLFVMPLCGLSYEKERETVTRERKNWANKGKTKRQNTRKEGKKGKRRIKWKSRNNGMYTKFWYKYEVNSGMWRK
jgi:hypothetical protein